uniref:FAD-binding FR-type domain-containing protein n=1 Tax=Branchiostoma floridae TaxID=7739 RepID=C3YUJ9_BRAFL|eukprot:XP_002599888.1 hypothetical protein BRAFLDRAFT_212399 [Branchiostoma floridae]
MCRTVLAVIRGSTQCVGRKARRVLDGSRKFHMLCGAAICVAAATHCLGHFYNALNFSEHYNVKYPEVNLVCNTKQTMSFLMPTTVPGLTGVAMVLLLMLIVSTSSMAIRTVNYELFWYTHHLFLILYCLMLLHPMRGILKEQLNLDEHPPGCHMLMDTGGSNDTLNVTSEPEPEPEPYHGLMSYPEPEAEPLPEGSTDEFGRIVTCKGPPVFDTHAVEVWVWLVGPFCLYCAERVYRLVRSNSPAAISGIIEHPDEVVEVQLTKEGFVAKPGQYVVINCPDVSTLEYHPFTLTMPSSFRLMSIRLYTRIYVHPFSRLHTHTHTQTNTHTHTHTHTCIRIAFVISDENIKCVAPLLLYEKVLLSNLCVQMVHTHRSLYVDGPFGSPSENVFHYDVSLCIAGGIGITPFASVLNHLLNEGTKSSRLRRLYLVWVCKNITSFLWIAQVLCSLQRQAWNENRPDFLNIHLHLTRSRDVQILEREYPFLNSRVHVGRPQWRHIFDEVARYNPRTSIGVFLCGPKGMSKGVKKICLKKNKFHTKFEFHKENF